MYGTVRLFAHPANLPTVSRVDRFFGTCADVHGDSDYVRKEYRVFFFEGEILRSKRERERERRTCAQIIGCISSRGVESSVSHPLLIQTEQPATIWIPYVYSDVQCGSLP